MVIYLLWWEVKKHLKHLKVYCSITSIDLSYNPRQIKKRPTVRLIFSKPPVNNESGICVSWRCFQPVLAQPSGTRKQELKVYVPYEILYVIPKSLKDIIWMRKSLLGGCFSWFMISMVGSGSPKRW